MKKLTGKVMSLAKNTRKSKRKKLFIKIEKSVKYICIIFSII